MNQRTLKTALTISIVTLAALIAALWLTWVARQPGEPSGPAEAPPIVTLPDPKPLTDFTLTETDGQLFDLESLQGKWTFVFFGFTSCPDICPTTMASLAQTRKAIAMLAPAEDDVRFMFVSVDPQRDTPDVLGRYVGYFGQDIRGASGAEAQLQAFARQLGAAYKVEFVPGVKNYPVYHTTAVFLIDPKARLRGIVRPPFDPDRIASRFRALRNEE